MIAFSFFLGVYISAAVCVFIWSRDMFALDPRAQAWEKNLIGLGLAAIWPLIALWHIYVALRERFHRMQ